jgi:hypothetical protein
MAFHTLELNASPHYQAVRCNTQIRLAYLDYQAVRCNSQIRLAYLVYHATGV